MSSMPSEHFVQFYEDADCVLDSVSQFIATGLEGGEAGVVIATQAHREALERRLIAAGLDIVRAREEGRYVALDAAQTLTRFMDGGVPEQGRFVDVVGTTVMEASAEQPCPAVTAASASGNHPARSISGNSVVRPDFGGHAILNLLERRPSVSKSPGTAKAVTTLPLFSGESCQAPLVRLPPPRRSLRQTRSPCCRERT